MITVSKPSSYICENCSAEFTIKDEIFTCALCLKEFCVSCDSLSWYEDYEYNFSSSVFMEHLDDIQKPGKMCGHCIGKFLESQEAIKFFDNIPKNLLELISEYREGNSEENTI